MFVVLCYTFRIVVFTGMSFFRILFSKYRFVYMGGMFNEQE